MLSSKTALVFERDESLRALLKTILKQRGFSCDYAHTSEDFKASLNSGVYSVAFYDLEASWDHADTELTQFSQRSCGSTMLVLMTCGHHDIHEYWSQGLEATLNISLLDKPFGTKEVARLFSEEPTPMAHVC